MGDVQGKLLVFIGFLIGGGLMFYDPGGDLSYGLWGLAALLTFLGVLNWGVK
jgi:hypothetical protein